jgi:quercetin dioxygenase-like cupin family protein
MTDTLTLTPTEHITLRAADGDHVEVEAIYGPNGDPPPAHLHPAQDEHFEVLEGELQVRLDGRERTLGPGETLDIPRGTAHQMWNAGDARARVSWRTAPAGRTESWFRDLDALHREGRVGKDGMPGPLAFGVMLTEYRDVFQLAAGPRPLVRAGLAGLAVAGRLRGYRTAG